MSVDTFGDLLVHVCQRLEFAEANTAQMEMDLRKLRLDLKRILRADRQHECGPDSYDEPAVAGKDGQ